MMRWTQLLLFSGFMFAAGIFAGRILQSENASRGSISPETTTGNAAGFRSRTPISAFGQSPSRSVPPRPVETAGSSTSLDGPGKSLVSPLNRRATQPTVEIPLAQSEAAAQSIFLASLQAAISQPVASEAPSESAKHVPGSAAESRLRSLITEWLPHVSEHQVSVWVQEFSDWDPEAVRFVLEQRAAALSKTRAEPVRVVSLSTSIDELLADQRPRSGSADANLPWEEPDDAGTTLGSTDHHDLSATAVPDSVPQVVAERAGISEAWGRARQVFSRNLQGALMPGFRGSAVLLSSPPAVPTELIVSTRFDRGPSITTGSPLHVALPADPGLMFLLGDGFEVTRRGDFSVLSDGRLGLKQGEHEFALYNSPHCDVVAASIRILEDGRIMESEPASPADSAVESRSGMLSSEESSGREIGRLSVCHIARLDLLTSSDGVIFQLSAEVPRHSLSAEEFAHLPLSVGRIELSNVVIADERVMLQNLDQLLPTNPDETRRFP